MQMHLIWPLGLSLSHKEKQKVVGGQRLAASFLERCCNETVHHAHGLCLPVQDLLHTGVTRVACVVGHGALCCTNQTRADQSMQCVTASLADFVTLVPT